MLVVIALGLHTILLAGCASPDRGAGTTMEDAARRLRSMIDDAIARFKGDLSTSPAPDTPPVFCSEPPDGSETYSAGYGVRLDLPDDDATDGLLNRARGYWEDNGYEVESRGLDGDLPVIFARSDGYEISLQVVRARGVAEVSGNTPCLPRG